MLLAKPNKEGGIVHALQPHIDPEIIARIDHRTRRGETVFVRDVALILADEHSVMRELLKGPFPKGELVLSLALMPGTLTPSDRRMSTGTCREVQIGINRSRQSHQ